MVKVRKEKVYGCLLSIFWVNTFVLYRPRFGNFLQPKVRLQKVAPWQILLWIDVNYIYASFTPPGILLLSNVQQKRCKEFECATTNRIYKRKDTTPWTDGWLSMTQHPLSRRLASWECLADSLWSEIGWVLSSVVPAWLWRFLAAEGITGVEGGMVWLCEKFKTYII